MADAIIELTVVPLGQREKRFLHIRKLRGSGFLSGLHGYRLTSHGLRLFPRLADITPDGGYPLGGRRITTGIGGLDAMMGGGLWPGSATMVAGPSGSGKTIMGLHFIYGGAEHGERGIVATLQENPTQLDRMITGLGWPAADPAVEVMYRSPVDIYIDEWVHDLLEAVERTQARRILIDSLMDLQVAAIDETRFREFMYSLAQRFSRQEITVLSTYETPGPGGDARPLTARHLPPGRQRDHVRLPPRPRRHEPVPGRHQDQGQQPRLGHPPVQHQRRRHQPRDITGSRPGTPGCARTIGRGTTFSASVRFISRSAR